MRISGLVFFAIILIMLIAVCGCSGNPTVPNAQSPDGTITSGLERTSGSSSHNMWGLWQFVLDPDAGTMDVIPLRAGNMHVNALVLLEPPPGVDLKVSNLSFDGAVCDIDVTLIHPFPGLSQFIGFDVAGILFTKGTQSGYIHPDLLLAGDGDSRLLNPDGWTRWWNPVEFDIPGQPIFRYKDGLLGNKHEIAEFNCTLNGYKLFCDELEENEDVLTLDPESRAHFLHGFSNTRHYTIDFTGGIVFNYAVDASWELPVGDPPFTPEIYAPEANKPEAWAISMTETENSLFNDGSTYGGDLILTIDVWDHYNAGLNTLWVESPGNFIPEIVLAPTGGGDGYSTYVVDIIDAVPGPGSIDILIGIESEVIGYYDVLPDDPITAYFMYTADVSDQTPWPPGLYVDADYTGGDSNGSPEKPFVTIQDGMAVATTDDSIFVDYYDGGDNLYDTAGLVLISDVDLIGWNWNSSSPYKPKVTCLDGGKVFYGLNICNFLIEGFEIIVPAGPSFTKWVGGQGLCGVHFEDSDAIAGGGSTNDNTIRKCLFTGVVTIPAGYMPIHMEGAVGTTIELCEFRDILGVSSSSFDIINCVMGYCSDNTTIRQNWMHDLTADATTGSGRLEGIRLLWSDDIIITNNLMNAFNGINGYSNIRGIYIDGQGGIYHSNNPLVANNTINDTHCGATGFNNAITFSNTIHGEFAIPDIQIYNNIVSNTYGSPSSCAYTHVQPDPYETYMALFCNAYNTAYLDSGGYNGYIGIGMGTGTYGNWTNPQDPDYIDPLNNYFDLSEESTSQYGAPDIVDWDDTGDPSGDQHDHDINTRSRMGAFGGPGGGWWPLD